MSCADAHKQGKLSEKSMKLLRHCAVREFVKKSAASAASLDYVKLQAVIKSAASAASLRGGRASGRLDHGHFL